MGMCEALFTSFFGLLFLWFCRTWGLITSIAMLGISAEVIYYSEPLGYYILSVGVLLTCLEAVFAVHYFVILCFSPDTRCRGCWDVVLMLDDWKKGLLYLVLSIACFLKPVKVWLGVIGGTMLVLCGMFYMLKTFKTRADRNRIKLAQKPSYDKFDEIQEDLDDDEDDGGDGNVMQPGTISIMSDDIGDQQEILEV